jgi:hypothetical protein
MMGVGYSNADTEFQRFVDDLAFYPDVNPYLEVVNAAFPGCLGKHVEPGGRCWPLYDSALAASDIAPSEVQIVWWKFYDTTAGLEGSALVDRFRERLTGQISELMVQYPNVKQVYISSRTYGGYASNGGLTLGPEPVSFRSGEGVDAFIAQGHPDVWVSWGPYLWANGLIPNAEGLIWECSDFQGYDGVHPAEGANQKVADKLYGFFSTDPVAAQWFMDNAPPPPPPPPDPVDLLEQLINEINSGTLTDLTEIVTRLDEVLTLLR